MGGEIYSSSQFWRISVRNGGEGMVEFRAAGTCGIDCLHEQTRNHRDQVGQSLELSPLKIPWPGKMTSAARKQESKHEPVGDVARSNHSSLSSDHLS